MEIVAEYDVPSEEILELANFPLKKIAEAVGKAAPDGEKGQVAQNFMDAVEAENIINTSDTRYTLS